MFPRTRFNPVRGWGTAALLPGKLACDTWNQLFPSQCRPLGSTWHPSDLASWVMFWQGCSLWGHSHF